MTNNYNNLKNNKDLAKCVFFLIELCIWKESSSFCCVPYKGLIQNV